MRPVVDLGERTRRRAATPPGLETPAGPNGALLGPTSPQAVQWLQSSAGNASVVSGAAAAAVATAVLLALLTAALVAGWGGGPAAAYGSAAFGAAGLAVGLLVLARAGAVARTGESGCR